MDNKIAQKRAEISGKLTNVLDSRSLTTNKRLGELLTEGMTVLDIGCGTGAITRGIADAVGPNGRVVGVDNNPSLIDKAQHSHSIPWLTFETCDIYNLPYHQQFDIVTASRVLIWLSDPYKAIEMMKAATKVGGRVLIVDYNHEKISWEPQPPHSMLAFYSSYLMWRSDAGIDNSIADKLSYLFQRAGFKEITITPQDEVTIRTDPDFHSRMCIWADTASSRGPAIEKDGFITEMKYKKAEKEYREWVTQYAQSLTMYMLAVEGVRST